MPRILLDTYDEVTVQRVIDGRHAGSRVTGADRWEAVRRLARLKFSDGQIAYIIGCTARNVMHIRRRLGVPAGLPPGSNQADWVHQVPTRRDPWGT